MPGHEVAGVVDAVGSDVSQWREGDRVGVGWHGGHCFTCAACREGDFVNCENGLVTGIHFDGGYAEYMTAPAEALHGLGGADVILATAPNSDAITSVGGGLRRDGSLVVVAATGEPIEVPPMALIQGRTSVTGWPSGSADDSEDTLDFRDCFDFRPYCDSGICTPASVPVRLTGSGSPGRARTVSSRYVLLGRPSFEIKTVS